MDHEVGRQKQEQPEQEQAWEQLLERAPLESARHLVLETETTGAGGSCLQKSKAMVPSSLSARVADRLPLSKVLLEREDVLVGLALLWSRQDVLARGWIPQTMGLAGSIGAHVDTASAGAVTLVTVNSRDPGEDLATKGEQAADVDGPLGIGLRMFPN